jgi:peptidoglycan/LPS O-acetylase OafA/YrhL
MSTKHLSYLDSLRGLECMVVVWVHFVFFMYPGIYQGTYSGETINYHNFLNTQLFVLLQNGNTAVSVFFILSGFVLSYRFMGANGMKWSIVESIIKRPIRLAGIILFIALPAFNFLLTKDFWLNRLWIDYDSYARTFWGVFTGLFSSNAYLANPPLWTINTELWGSFLVFGLCFIIGNLHKKVRLTLMLIAMIYFSHSYYFLFVFGMMLADFHKNW